MNASQFLEFLVGSKYGAKMKGATAEKVDALRREFRTSAQKSIRDQIEITLPLIYLVRPYDIVTFNIEGLLDQSDELSRMVNDFGILEQNLGSDKEYKKASDTLLKKKNALADFIPYITIDGVKYVPGDAKYHQALKNTLNALNSSSSIKAIGDKIFADLRKTGGKFKKKITLEALGERAQKTNNYLVKVDSALAQIYHLTGVSNSVVEQTEEKARRVIRKVSESQKKWLEQNTPAEFEDPNSFLNGYDSSTDFLFVSTKFKSDSSGARDLANEASKQHIIDALISIKQYGELTVAKNYSVGAFAAAGHTGAVAQENVTSAKEVIGGNFPLLQQVMTWATEQSDISKISNISSVSFVENTDHLNLSLSFKKGDPAKFAKDLLSANFSFAFTQRATYNSNVLSHQETAEMDRQIEAAFGITRKELARIFTEKFYSKEGRRNLLSTLRFSPTVKESVAKLLYSTLSGLAPQSLGSPSARAGSRGTGGRAKNVSLPKIPATNKVSLKSSGTKNRTGSAPIKMESVEAPTVDIISLQNLINTQLQDVISANMGNGASKTILNYRTGRFASSVNVERMSISRQGMITAYYSYMKNPYATFSAGGKQSVPESRDPKLLISKSIREIAQELVANKLRAVSL
jgi:hypothetical protein